MTDIEVVLASSAKRNNLESDSFSYVPSGPDTDDIVGDIAENVPIKDDIVSAPVKRPRGWGRRHTLSILGFFGFCTAYAMRFNLSMAIVAMIHSDISDVKEQKTLSNETEVHCELPDEDEMTNNKTSKVMPEGEFYWDPTSQGLVLAAFFWGYPITQIPGGFLTAKYGGRLTMGIGLLISGVMTLFIPVCARVNIAMIMFCRIVQGLAQGVIFPGMQQLLANWSPINERTSLSTLSYSGCHFGTAFTMITSGYLMESAGGWPSVFYFTGSISIFWCILWAYFIYDSPAEHPSISAAEKAYIQYGKEVLDKYADVKTPWRAILTSKPVWVISIADLCHSWGFYTLLIELPMFLKKVLHFSIEDDSWISAAPNIILLTFAISVAYAADYFISKRWVKIITARKACNLISEMGSAFCLIGTAFVGCDRTAAVVLLTLASGVSGASIASTTPNQTDIAPNHAGAIMGITNTFANLMGFVVSIVVAEITKNGEDPEKWKVVFLLAAGIYILGAIIYTVFATSDEQPWNRINKDNNPNTDPQ